MRSPKIRAHSHPSFIGVSEALFVRFGEFDLDTGARLLLRLGRPVPLSPRGFKLLEMLVERRPLPVPRAELLEALWPDTYVSEGNLPNAVWEVRKALDDEASALVRTVYGIGYAFTCELSAASTSRAIITVMLEGRVVGLPDGENTIGRGLDCLVQVHCPLASRKHARIVVDKDQATIEDGPSMHGTFVNERRITSATRLRTGDIIRVGSVDLTLKVVRPDAPTDRPTSPQ